MLSSHIQCYFVLAVKSLNEKENLFVISTLMDIQGIEPWTSRMRSVRATTVPNALERLEATSLQKRQTSGYRAA